MKARLTYLAVILLVVGGLVVAAFTSPVWYDDVGHWLVAREISRGEGMCYPLEAGSMRNASKSGFITMGPILAYPIGGWMAVFGESMLTARLLMVGFSLLAMWAFFRLARSLTDSVKAAVAVALIGMNIQFLTYGAEVLGEVPMMGFVLPGAGFLVRWWHSGRLAWGAAGIFSWCLAIGIKEYAILPLALCLLFWAFVTDRQSGDGLRIVYLGIGFLVALTLAIMVLHGETNLLAYFISRRSYGSEFFAFRFENSLKYLALKPLFWLGTVAMVVKWRVKRRAEDALMLGLQFGWLVFYLLSAGYDRFGFLLLFLPAIYLAEFAPYLWKEAGRNPRWRWVRRGALVVVAFAVFSQQTYWLMGSRLVDPGQVNAAERAAVDALHQLPADAVVLTVDQHVVPFLEEAGLHWRLVNFVPSQARLCANWWPEYIPGDGEVFLAGPYAFTEYEKCIGFERMSLVWQQGEGEGKWGLYVAKGN